MATRDWTVENSKMVTEKSVYTDLDIKMIAHPITGDITSKKDSTAIKNAIRNIVLTNSYERPFKPNFGANLRAQLFELGTPTAMQRMKMSIAEEIEILEPRVSVSDIVILQRDNSVDVKIAYVIGGAAGPQQIDFTVSRVR